MNYNPRSEKALIGMQSALEPVQKLKGVYRSELPGPKLLHPIKRLFLSLSGLPNWDGKDFKENTAINLVSRYGIEFDGPKMNLIHGIHRCDGKEGLIATYTSKAPYLWRKCTDEFRWLDETTVLGISYFDIPLLRNKAVPFILHQQNF